jgi:hypothetical protein
MSDSRCRNCGFRFIPTFWVDGGGQLVGRCPNCGSNATHTIEEPETKIYGPDASKGKSEEPSYEVPKTTAGGKIRLDE